MPSTNSSSRPSWPNIAALIAVAACARFLPHMPANFSPVGAMGLYAGAMLSWPWALAISLTGLFFSDLVLGLYNPITMLFVYVGLGLNVFLGTWICSLNGNPARIATASLAGAILFFIVSNFGVWLSGGLYLRDLNGFVECYVAAIPFFGNTLASELLFGFILFGLHHAMEVLRLRRESLR